MTNKILIVEDDIDILQLMSLSLSSQNIKNVFTATNLNDAKRLILNHTFQVVLLDLNLGSESGYQLMKYINFNMTKVIVVTAKDSETDVYIGFEKGAIDYVKKPFDPIELAYRVKVHLKPVHRMKYGDITVDTSTAEVFKANMKIHLTTREYDLLTCFMANNNQILTKEQLYLNVWGYDKGVDDNTLMVHIRTLRKKIEDNPEKPELIQTVRGKGYIFRGAHNE